ncbi:MAG: hypothetical protein WCK51_00465 [Armatimonadota bacterium]
MTARELIEKQLDETGFQFNACLKDLTEETFEAKPVAVLMSCKETVEHSMEALQAVITGVAGGTHSWGTYQAPALPMTQLIETFNSLRGLAIEAGLSVFDDDAHWLNDYLVLHEVYHVGQMAAVRHALGDGWDSYAIYR